jgi:hypothetical protein|tara:strand:- start:1221 stop:1406 length:186 start_codon:yes stop_codon:yes gene_type:complete
MAYTNESIKIRVSFDSVSLEWRWQVIANGTALGEIAADTGACATHTEALAAVDAAITARLA